MTNKPSSLYIHIPFCEHICYYCDFPKLQYFTFLAEKYLARLQEELVSLAIDHPLKTIYIGGGTPTSLEDTLFEKLLDMIQPYSKEVEEFTIEANPESLSVPKLNLMRKYGVNRISLGVESTDDKILSLLNRHHTFNDVKVAIQNARKLGFDNINVDLILGLPQVNKSMLLNDINRLIGLEVDHISCYSLSIHPHTKFYLDGIKEVSEDYSRELYDLIAKRLNEEGYIHYEVSNWAKPGFFSLHNLTYWKDDQYYGIGLGASGFVDKYRYRNTNSINQYNDGHFLDSRELVTYEDDKTYYIMLSLRTVFGLSFVEYQKRFGEDFLSIHQKSIESFIDEGLLKIEKKHLIPTYEGMMILDQIIVQFISE
ncbi:MAG TPA: radical SAM family heme chaperone HemW [Bacilli bacterium]|nr:radical SAM family heme chaperone HemW [Bacilli bacterium]